MQAISERPRPAAAACQDPQLQRWHDLLRGSDGKAAAAALHGSFAVWADDGRGRTLMAVDRFAQRSLCWAVRDGSLFVGARADAVAADMARAAGGSPALCPQALYDYLYFHAIPSPRTVYQGVFRLPPGHVATFAEGRVTVERYWTPSFGDGAGAGSFESLRDEFRALLRDAAAARLDGSRAACFLSGGTDSSTVAGMIREVTGHGADTFSIGFEAEGYDEMAYARLAARHFGAVHNEYYVTPADLVRSMADVAAYYDQPFGNSSALPSYYCSRLAHDKGVSRILAGDGGDELFGGNERYAKQRVFEFYGRVPGALRRGLMEPLAETAAMQKLPLLRKAASYVRQARVPLPDRLHTYNLLLRLDAASVLEPNFLRSVDTSLPIAEQREVWLQADAATTLDRSLALDWRYTLAENDLPKVVGTTRMAGLDVAFPLLDDALVAFSTRLPQNYKLRGNQLRWFFKEALRGFLPDAILTKSKHGFGLPFGVWAVRHEGLKALSRDALHSIAKRGIVRPAFVTELLDTLLPAHPHYYGEMVWILTMLELWLQRHAPGFKVDAG